MQTNIKQNKTSSIRHQYCFFFNNTTIHSSFFHNIPNLKLTYKNIQLEITSYFQNSILQTNNII